MVGCMVRQIKPARRGPLRRFESRKTASRSLGRTLGASMVRLRSPDRARHERNGAPVPQLDGGWFLTDAGLETVLIFQEGIALPEFAAFVLLQSQEGATTCAAISAAS